MVAIATPSMAAEQNRLIEESKMSSIESARVSPSTSSSSHPLRSRMLAVNVDDRFEWGQIIMNRNGNEKEGDRRYESKEMKDQKQHNNGKNGTYKNKGGDNIAAIVTVNPTVRPTFSPSWPPTTMVRD